MELPLLLIITIELLSAVFIILLAAASRSPVEPSYERRLVLFTPAERSLLVPEAVVGDHCRAFGKVRVVDVLSVRKSSDRRACRIACKHVDFVLCVQNTMMIVALLELDDQFHGWRKRRWWGGFVNE